MGTMRGVFLLCLIPLSFLVVSMIPGVTWRTVEVNMNPHKHKISSDMWEIHTSGRIDFNSQKQRTGKKPYPVLQYADETENIFSDSNEQYPFFARTVQKTYQATTNFIDTVSSTATEALGFVDSASSTISDLDSIVDLGMVPDAAAQVQGAGEVVSPLLEGLSRSESDTIPSILTYSGDNSPNCRLNPQESTEWDNERARDPSTLTGISGTYNSIIKSGMMGNLRRTIIDVAKPLGDIIYLGLGALSAGSTDDTPNPFSNAVNPNADIARGEAGRRYDEYSFNMLMPFVADSSPLSFNKEALSSFLEFQCRQMVKDGDPAAVRCRRFMAKWIFPDTPSGHGTPTRLGVAAERIIGSVGLTLPDLSSENLQSELFNFVEFLPKNSPQGEYLPKTYADVKFKTRTRKVELFENEHVKQTGTDYLQVFNINGTGKWEYVCVPDDGIIDFQTMDQNQREALQFSAQEKYQRLVSTICQNELGMAVDYDTFAAYAPVSYTNKPWPGELYYKENHPSNANKKCLDIDLNCVNQYRWGKQRAGEATVDLSGNTVGVPDSPFNGGYIGTDTLSTCTKERHSDSPRSLKYLRISCLDMRTYESKESFLLDDETNIAEDINEYVRDLDFLVPDQYTGAIDFFRKLSEFVYDLVTGNRVCPPLDVVSSAADCRTISSLASDNSSLPRCDQLRNVDFFGNSTYCYYEKLKVLEGAQSWRGSCFKEKLASCPELSGVIPAANDESTLTYYKVKKLSDKVLSESGFVFAGQTVVRPQTLTRSLNIVFAVIEYLGKLSPALNELGKFDFVLTSLPLEFFQLEFLRDLTTSQASGLVDSAMGVSEEYRNSTKWFGQVAAYHEMFTPARTDYSADADLYFYTALENELNDILAALPQSNWDPVSAQIFEEAFDGDGNVIWPKLMALNPSIGAGYALATGQLGVLFEYSGADLQASVGVVQGFFASSPILESREACQADRAACIVQFETLKATVMQGEALILDLILTLVEGISKGSLPFKTRQQIRYPETADDNLCYDLLDGYRRFLGLTMVDVHIRGYDKKRDYLIPTYELEYCDMEGKFNLNREINNYRVIGGGEFSGDTTPTTVNFILGTLIRPLLLPEFLKSDAPITKTLLKIDELLGIGTPLTTMTLELIFRYPRYITSLNPVPLEEWPKSAQNRALATSVADGAHPQALEAVIKAYGAFLAMIAMDHREQFCGFEVEYFDLKTSSATYRPRIVQVMMTWLGAGFSAQGHNPTQSDTKHALAALTTMSYNAPALLLENATAFKVPKEVAAGMADRYNGQYHISSGTKFLAASAVRKARSNPDFKPFVNLRNGQTKHSAYNPCVGKIDNVERQANPELTDESFSVSVNLSRIFSGSGGRAVHRRSVGAHRARRGAAVLSEAVFETDGQNVPHCVTYSDPCNEDEARENCLYGYGLLDGSLNFSTPGYLNVTQQSQPTVVWKNYDAGCPKGSIFYTTEWSNNLCNEAFLNYDVFTWTELELGDLNCNSSNTENCTFYGNYNDTKALCETVPACIGIYNETWANSTCDTCNWKIGTDFLAINQTTSNTTTTPKRSLITRSISAPSDGIYCNQSAATCVILPIGKPLDYGVENNAKLTYKCANYDKYGELAEIAWSNPDAGTFVQNQSFYVPDPVVIESDGSESQPFCSGQDYVTEDGLPPDLNTTLDACAKYVCGTYTGSISGPWVYSSANFSNDPKTETYTSAASWAVIYDAGENVTGGRVNYTEVNVTRKIAKMTVECIFNGTAADLSPTLPNTSGSDDDDDGILDNIMSGLENLVMGLEDAFEELVGALNNSEITTDFDFLNGRATATMPQRTRTSAPARMCPPLTQWDGYKGAPELMGLVSSNAEADAKISCKTISRGALYTNLPRCSHAENQLCMDNGECGFDASKNPSACDNPGSGVDATPIYWAGSSNDYKNPGFCADYLTYAPVSLEPNSPNSFERIYNEAWETNPVPRTNSDNYSAEFPNILADNPIFPASLADAILSKTGTYDAASLQYFLAYPDKLGGGGAQGNLYPFNQLDFEFNTEIAFSFLFRGLHSEVLDGSVSPDQYAPFLPNNTDGNYRMVAAKKKGYNRGMTLPTCDQRSRVEIMQTLQEYFRIVAIDPNRSIIIEAIFNGTVHENITRQQGAYKMIRYFHDVLNPDPGTSVPCVPYLESRAYKEKYPELGAPCGISEPIYEALSSVEPGYFDDFYLQGVRGVTFEGAPPQPLLERFCASFPSFNDFRTETTADCITRIDAKRANSIDPSLDFDYFPLHMSSTTKRIMTMQCPMRDADNKLFTYPLHIREYSMPQSLKFTDAKDIMFHSSKTNEPLATLEEEINRWTSQQLNIGANFNQFPDADAGVIAACLNKNPLRFRLAVAPEEAMSTYLRQFQYPEIDQFTNYTRLRWYLSQFTTVRQVSVPAAGVPINHATLLPCCVCAEWGCQCAPEFIRNGGNCTGAILPNGRYFNDDDFEELSRVYEDYNKNLVFGIESIVETRNDRSIINELYNAFVSDESRRLKLIPYEGYDIEAVSEIMRGTISYGAKSMLQVLADSKSPYVCPWVPAADYVPTWWSVDPDQRAEPIPPGEEAPYKTNIMGGYGSYAPFCNDFQPMSDYSGTFKQFANFTGTDAICLSDASGSFPLVAPLYQDASVNDYLFPMILDYTMDDGRTRRKLGLDFMRCSLQNWNNHDYLKLQNCINDLPYRDELPLFLKSQGAQNVEKWTEWKMCPLRRSHTIMFITAASLGALQIVVAIVYAIFGPRFSSKWQKATYITHIILALVTSIILFVSMAEWRKGDEGIGDYSTNYERFLDEVLGRSATDKLYNIAESVQTRDDGPGAALGWVAATLYMVLFLVLIIAYRVAFKKNASGALDISATKKGDINENSRVISSLYF